MSDVKKRMTLSEDMSSDPGKYLLIIGSAILILWYIGLTSGACNKVGNFIGSFFNSTNGSSTIMDEYGHDKYDAIAIAEKTVKSQLKSPTSAKFNKVSEYTVSLTGNTWTVRGYVDAQNSLGATIRNDFLVILTFSSSSAYEIDLCSIK